MKLTTAQFKTDYRKLLKTLYAEEQDELSTSEQFLVLGNLVRQYLADQWQQTTAEYNRTQRKQVYYFSIEFLPGRLLESNLLNLGILDTVRAGSKELGLDFDQLVAAEPDPGLGNGGLGRLASCFMDSLASMQIAGNGNGIRYRYGLFKQAFINGYQVELPDDWLRNGNVWEVCKESKACTVRFGGNVYLRRDEASGQLVPVYENTQDVLAVPYDTAMLGYHNHVGNTMRLWSAELPPQADDHYYTQADKAAVARITEVLYPDDSNYDGQLLRLHQEYFFSSAGVQSIIRHYRRHQQSLVDLGHQIAIHINDTHPTLVIPELMRILLDEEHLDWSVAWRITTQVMSYTNHTILQEALEKWPQDMLARELPRIYQIIAEIDRRFRVEMTPIYGAERVQRSAPFGDGQVRMAYLAVIGSHSTNGVAKLHTELLQRDVLADLYAIYPERFNNKTNGITLRRWVQLANEPLSELLDQQIGSSWRSASSELETVKAYQNDPAFLAKLAQVKLTNKQRLADYVAATLQIKIDPTALFDVQIKRLHAYKRQLLHVLGIIDLYQRIKAAPDEHYQARVHIFGAKAAPSYYYAKEIIKLINALADLVNHDPAMRDRLKIVFLPNYSVSLAEKIIPAADIGEQISTASKEASGTSNMKLMANGALALATLDGANIEIRDAVGADNLFLFGLTVDEVYAYYAQQNYRAQTLYDQSPRIRRILDALVDGTIPGIQTEGRDIYDSLLRFNDDYFVVRDLESYLAAQAQIDQAYQDQNQWQQRALENIAFAGRFSADKTVNRYAEDIWHVHHQSRPETK